MIALFNNEKNFIGFCENLPEQNNINLFKMEVPEKYANPLKYTWIGDFYNGEFIEIEKAALIKSQEEKIENINKQYPIQIQLLNIIKQLNILSKKENIYDCNFKQMSEEILNIWK
jgi:hypothetical protein